MKMLLAIDGSGHSEFATTLLSRLRFASDDEIIIFHAISWVPFKDDRESHYAGLQEIKRGIAPKILDSAVNILSSAKARISTALGEGYADRAIIEAAADSKADLIVMGARGLKGIKSLIIGSVTRSVAMNSPAPVLIAKLPQWEPSERIKILLATDGSDQADAICRFLAKMPFPDDAEITILHAIWSPLSDIPGRYILEVDERVKESVAKARSIEYAESGRILDQAKKVLSERFPSIQTLTRVGDPSLEILNEAEILKADIVAAGSGGLRGIKGMMGSVSRSIIVHSPCSVLIGRAQ